MFAWTQNRLLLPSWYGAGTALAAGDLELQREMWRDWPFFRGLIGTLEMALFKSDLGVAERYLTLVDEDIAERFWTDLRLRVRPGRRARADRHRPGSAAGRDACAAARLEHRNPWIDPLSHLQVELLRRVRAGREEARTPLLATITGIAAGDAQHGLGDRLWSTPLGEALPSGRTTLAQTSTPGCAGTSTSPLGWSSAKAWVSAGSSVPARRVATTSVAASGGAS